MCSHFELPPTMIEHLTDPHRPEVYYWFWSIGGVCVVTTFGLLFKRIHQLYHNAIRIRDKEDEVLLPYSYSACMLIVLFPVVASIMKYFILLSPISAFSVDFIIITYEGMVLYMFARLLIMYLGSIKNAMNALDKAPKAKFWAVAPFGCCFKLCCKARTMRKQDFRITYNLILQYAYFAPVATFALVLRTYEGDKYGLWIIKCSKLLSAMLCFYGLLSLLRASSALLKQHRIHGKFWCIKGLIVAMIVPEFIISIFHTLPEQDETYDHETMVEAYGAMTSIFCFTALSALFLRYFRCEDALNAMRNAKYKDHNASDQQLTPKKKGKKQYNMVNNDENTELKDTPMGNTYESKSNGKINIEIVSPYNKNSNSIQK